MNAAASEVLLTEAEAMAHLVARNVPASRRHLLRERQAGRLVAYSFGRTLRYSMADLNAWVASHRTRVAQS